jgi:hypothetical protein
LRLRRLASMRCDLSSVPWGCQRFGMGIPSNEFAAIWALIFASLPRMLC